MGMLAPCSVLFLTLSLTGQTQSSNRVSMVAGDSILPTKSFPKKYFSFHLEASVLPRATFDIKEGNYSLNSSLHSTFGSGVNYTNNFNEKWGMYSGIHIKLTKSNFYKKITNTELYGTGIIRADDAPPLIYYRDVYLRMSMPVMIVRRAFIGKKKFWDFRGGAILNFSGFSSDENISMSVENINNQQVKVFSADFSSNNNMKPWFSFSLGSSRNYFLNNGNLLAFSLLFEYSKTKYLDAVYQITIPNKPISTGLYSVTGSCLGLSVGYIFTGANKKFIKEYNKRKGTKFL